MTQPSEKTESLRDYAEVLGAPEPATTDRMRTRLDAYLVQRRSARRRALRLGVASLALAAATSAVFLFAMREDGPPALEATDAPRTVEIGRTKVTLQPGTELRASAEDERRIVLLAGEIEVTVHPEETFVVGCGEFEVRAQDARFSVRHASTIPVVNAERGGVTLLGPGLPHAGIRIVESPVR